MRIFIVDDLGDDAEPLGCEIVPELDQDWYSTKIMHREDFEDKQHTLEVFDNDGISHPTDGLSDIVIADAGVWAVWAEAKEFIEYCGRNNCRIASKVNCQGKKSFVLAYPEKTMDVLDHEKSLLTINGVSGSVSVVGYPVLAVSKVDRIPPLFRVLKKGPKRQSPSMRVYATEEFVSIYKRSELTGLKFNEVSVK